MSSSSTALPARLPRTFLAFGTVVFIVVGVLATFAAVDLRTDNSIEHWLDPASPATQDYERFKTVFGADEFIVVSLSEKPLFEAASLDVMLKAQDALLAVPHVQRVAGIPAVYRELFGGEDAEALEAEFTATPFYEGLFISKDHKVAGLFLEIDPPNNAPERRAMVHAVERAVVPLREFGFRVDLIGPPTLNTALDEVSERETNRAMPIALACSVVVLMLLLRGVRATLIACVCAWLSVVIPMGFIDATGYPLTMVSAVLPPLMWALSLAHTVHFITQYYHHRHEGNDLHGAVASAWHDIWLPCSLAAVTTSAGFLSLIFSTMPPIVQMGFFASFAIVVSVAANLTVAPTLTVLLRVPPRHKAKSLWVPVLLRAEQFVERRAWIIVIVFGIIGVAGAVSITKLRPEPNPLTFLPKSAQAVASYDYVVEHLTGQCTLEVVVSCPNGWLDPTCWPRIDALTKEISATSSVARVLSPLDVLRKLNQWDHQFDPGAYALPASREDAVRLLREMPEWSRRELDRLASKDGGQIRLSLLVRSTDSDSFYALAKETRARLAILDGGMSAHLTGIVLLLNNAQVQLVLTQVNSFAFSFIVVFAIIAIGLRSIRLMGLSIAPTLIPTLSAFAFMLPMGIPLDAATVLVAGVALGMADDSTIHLIAAYRRVRRPGEPVGEALSAALGEVGPAIIYSTGTSCIGFFALCGSGFIPIRYFGLLSGIALLASLLANLLLTPAMIVLMARRRKGPESSEL